jgi:hypothetical protein
LRWRDALLRSNSLGSSPLERSGETFVDWVHVVFVCAFHQACKAGGPGMKEIAKWGRGTG